MAPLANRIFDLELVNDGLHRSRVGSGDRTIGVSVIDSTLASKEYTDAFDRVLSGIIEIRETQ